MPSRFLIAINKNKVILILKGVIMLNQNDLINIPVVVEIVAVPSTFDIELYLSMRESAGMFQGDETVLSHVKFIADTIKASPYFVLTKCPDKTIQSALFCLHIFNEAGLTIDSNYSEAYDSKKRGRSWEWATKMNFLKIKSKDVSKARKRWNDNSSKDYGISQEAFVMVIINLYALIESGILEPVIEKVVEAEDRVKHLNETINMIK
jgi:hypothetical protein